MSLRQGLLVLLAAGLAGCLGLAASVAINGPGALGGSWPGRSLPPEAQAGSGGVAIGATVPSFPLVDLGGKARTLPTPGKTLLINYWASWCTPCREELPLLGEFARQAGPSVEVIGIALDTPAEATAFLRARPLGFGVLVETPGPTDSSVRLGNRRGVLPFSVLIAADGRLLARRFGAFSDGDDLRRWVSAAR